MKPISLKIKGIKNYQIEQFIDFESLASEGVFGICGKTGSGKSAIMESIIIALFGDLPSGRGYNYEIVNLTDKQADIEFVFSLNKDGQQKKYLIERQLKTQTENRMSAQIFDITNQKISLASGLRDVKNYVIDLLKLNEKDFTQCVILEQGQYDKFVTADASERKKMIGNIFSLNKYGDELNNKVLDYRREYQGKADGLKSFLQSFGEIDKAMIDEKRKIYQDYEMRFEEILKQIEQADQQLKELEKLYQEYQDYQNLQSQIKRAQDNKKVLEKKINELKQDYTQKAAQAQQTKNLSQKKEQLKSYIDTLNDNHQNKKKIKSLIEQKAQKAQEYIKIKSDISHINKNLQKARYDQEQYTKRINADLETLHNLVKIRLTLDEKLAVNLVNKFSEYSQDVQKYVDLNKELKELTQSIKDDSEKLDGFYKLQADIIKNQNEYKKTLEQLEKEYARFIEHNAKALISSQVKIGDKCPICDNVITRLPEDFEIVGLEDITAQIDNWKKAYYDITQTQASQAQDINNTQKAIKEKQEKAKKLQDEIKKLKLNDSCIQTKKQFETVKNNCLDLLEKITKAQNDIREQKALLEKNELLLEKIEQEGKKLAQEIEELQDNLKKILGSYADFDQALKNSNEQYKKLEAQIEELTKAERAADKALNEARTDLVKIQTELKGFQDRIALLSPRPITQEQIQNARQRKTELDEAQKKLSQNLGELKGEIARLEQDLIKYNEAKKEIAKVQKKLDIINQLHKLTTSNKLMEFMAEEYIEEFTYTASEYLNLLTMGQFELVYDNSFLIKDHFCGGQLRKVNTVSGGEMFLVSLSLAISISRALSLRSGAAAVEFLFIDEGFGTLDSDLIDTVMDALEKLKDSFIIGLISHRAELQQRLPKKLYVERTSKGSIISYQ
jgi:exonuclease SbcC